MFLKCRFNCRVSKYFSNNSTHNNLSLNNLTYTNSHINSNTICNRCLNSSSFRYLNNECHSIFLLRIRYVYLRILWI